MELTTGVKSKIQYLLESDKHLDRLVGSICTMDLDCVDCVIGDIQHCNNSTKYEFYSQLTNLFDYSKKSGDKYFKVYAASCAASDCNNNDCIRYLFTGNHTGNYFGFNFKVERGKVVWFAECVCIQSPVATKPGAELLMVSPNPF